MPVAECPKPYILALRLVGGGDRGESRGRINASWKWEVVMRVAALNAALLYVCVGVGIGCAGSPGESATGTLSVNLVGSAPTGTVYRLRDAVITVNGPVNTVFDTEVDPDQTALSADVDPGDYVATVAPGWRIERLDGGTAATVSATLTSDNPALFSVVAGQRTTVPLRFRVDQGDVDLTQGYDIILDIDEQIPSPGDAYQAIDAPSVRGRLVFDAARQALYGVNTVDQEIERFSFDGSKWSAGDPLVVPQLTDVAITPDGETLIVLDSDHVSDIALSGAFTPTLRATNTDTFCGAFFAKAAVGSNGKVFIARDYEQCSGFTTAFFYDMTSHALSSTTSLINPTIGASADGTRIYVGSNGLFPPDEVSIYNAQSNTFSTSSVDVNLFAVSVSGDASRVILQHSQVYSRALTLLGNVPAGGVALASRDSSRAFVYLDDAPGPRLAIYDLNGTLQPGAVFPLARTIRLPDSPNVANGGGAPVSMTSSADDSLVFISGDRRVLVVPVN
jgi:hypothetical protein